MQKSHKLAILLTLLTGMMLGGAAIAAEHAGDAAESDSSATTHASDTGSHDKDAKGDEHAGEAAHAESEDSDSGDEHAGESVDGDDS